MYRRWVYMAVAITATALLTLGPLFSFNEDRGIIYMRSFEMDQHKFIVYQTELENGLVHVNDVISVQGLHWCYIAMLLGSIACFLCFYHTQARIVACFFTIGASAAYYLVGVHYAIEISNYYATLFPTWIAILPAVVIQMMILTHRNVITYGNYLDMDADDERP